MLDSGKATIAVQNILYTRDWSYLGDDADNIIYGASSYNTINSLPNCHIILEKAQKKLEFWHQRQSKYGNVHANDFKLAIRAIASASVLCSVYDEVNK